MIAARFHREPRLLVLVIGVVVVAGLAALQALPRQEDPTLVNRFATVVTPYPGAPADRVEALVSRPIEEALREVDHVDTITSTSRSGVSAVQVTLSEAIADTEPVFSRLRDALDDAVAGFPRGAGAPVFDDDRGPPAYTMLVAVTWTAEAPVNRLILRRLADALKSRLEARPGTELADLYGEPVEEVRVDADADALAALGLTPRAVAQAIAGGDAKAPAGVLEGRAADLPVEVTGALDTVARVLAIPLARDEGGGLVTVADVATVRRGVVDPPASLALVDGREAVILALRMAPERRVDRWAAGMRAAVADFAATLPAGIALDIRFDQSAHTDRRLADLAGNLALGAALVVGVLMVTLGWRAALVVATALPLTSLAALAALNAWGVPIHQMSVTGLIVALGLVVDSAIVMTDAVRAGRARGLGPAAAVSAAADRLWLPLASATVTTILAFMPIALMPGSAGEFVGPIAYSVILALVTSYAVAMTVVPALAGRFLAGAGEARGRLAGLADRGLRLPGAARLFRRAVRLGLDHPRLSMLAASLPAVLGVVGMTTLPEQFFPPSDRAQFRIQVFLSDQASIERTQAVVAQADRALAARPEILAVDWVLGGSAPKIYYNVTQDQDRVPSYAEAQVSVRSVAAVARLIPELQGELDRLIPEARVLVRPYLQGPPVDAPVEIRIFGPEPSQLREIGEAVRRRLAGLADVTHVTTDLEGARPVLTVVADEAAARLSGLTPGGIARQLDAALAGAVGGTVVEGAEEMPVRVRVAGEARLSVAELSALALMPPGIAGEAWAAAGRAPPGADGLPAVPLTALAALALTPRASAIARRDGERVNAVVGHVGQGVLPATVLARLTTSLAADPVALPPGYRLEVGGDAAERDKAVGNLAGSLGLIAVLSVATLVLTFNAFRFAAVVAAVAGLSMGLGLLALTLAGYPFGFVVIVGLLGLAGVAINAAIIILSALKADPRALAGDRDRIADIVASDTSRHILSTTLTTFGGFLPLMLAPGGFWPPFAVTIAGGVALTTLVSFWFVPAAFSLLARPAAARAAAAARGPAVA